MHKLRILHAEDMAHERLVIEAGLRRVLPKFIEPEFYHVDHAEAAIAAAASSHFDLILLDIDFSGSPRSRGMSGLEAAKRIKVLSPASRVVVVSSAEDEATMRSAIENYEVDWYLRRSSISYEELSWLCRSALLSRLHEENMLVEPRYQFFTQTPLVKRLLRRIDSILPEQNTLICGETGTGKELIARRIHANAKAFDPKRPLKVLDCAAISPTLFEAEVFGYRKGAFTGANTDRVGALQLANGGDLFLDEVHNIPLDCQKKLLRVLNDGIFSPVGGPNEEIKSRFRIIAATNLPLDVAISSGRLLPDLVERIRKIRLELPPLRSRADDIPALAHSFASVAGSFDKEFSAEALAFLKAQPWPGNIRELRSVVETAIAEIKIPIIQRVHLESLTQYSSKKSATANSVQTVSTIEELTEAAIALELPLLATLEQLEATYLAKMSKRSSLSELSKKTGYSRATLYRRLQRFGLSSPNE